MLTFAGWIYICAPLVVQGQVTGSKLALSVFGFSLPALLGAGVAGFLLAGWFGRPGIAGWVRMFAGALGTTLLGGLIGGVVLIFWAGTILLLASEGNIWPQADELLVPVKIGVLIAIMWPAKYPWLVPVWVTMMVLIHLRARHLWKSDSGLLPDYRFRKY